MRGRKENKFMLIRSTILFVTLVTLAAVSTDLHIVSAAVAEGPGTSDYNREIEKKPVRNMMRAGAARSVNQSSGYGSEYATGQVLQLPPLPGEQGAFDSAKSSDSRKYYPQAEIIPDLGKNNRSSVNMVLPPLKGFMQLSDSEDMKNMFKEMVVAKVPVLFQTYMMVENGAAQGYTAGLNAVSNIMANTMHTQQYQLKLLELTDDTGKMKEAYIQKIKESSEQAKDWPATLFATVGDTADFNTVKNEPMRMEQQARAYDLKGLPSEDGNKKGGKRLLSDLLFLKSEKQNDSGGDPQDTFANNEQLYPSLKDEFRRLVGDVEIELAPPNGVSNENQGPDGWLRVLNMNLKAPKKEANEELRGVALENWNEVQVVWENIHTLLKDYCEFKKSKDNLQKEPGKKDSAATTDKIGQASGQEDPWELSSAPDIPISLNLIEQLFALVDGSEKPEDLKCDELKKTRDDIPNSRKGSAAKLDECGNNNGCLRNRIILHTAYIIARSRTLHTYRHMYLTSKKFATDPVLDDLVDRLFIRTLAGMKIDDALHNNRVAWSEFIPFLATFVETRTSVGGNPRPNQSSSTSPSAATNGGSGNGGL